MVRCLQLATSVSRRSTPVPTSWRDNPSQTFIWPARQKPTCRQKHLRLRSDIVHANHLTLQSTSFDFVGRHDILKFQIFMIVFNIHVLVTILTSSSCTEQPPLSARFSAPATSIDTKARWLAILGISCKLEPPSLKRHIASSVESSCIPSVPHSFQCLTRTTASVKALRRMPPS